MLKLSWWIGAGAALSLMSGPADAVLVDHSTYTSDTVSGLEWLDLTLTTGLSHDEVTARMTIGQPLEGWRYASRNEVRTFWTNAGGIGPFTGLAAGTTDWVGALQELWGKTYPFQYVVNGNLVQGTVAMTSDESPTCTTCNLTVYLLNNVNESGTSDGDYAEAEQLNEAYRWQGQTPIGHALVRSAVTPVPEPATWLLAAIGLGAVFWRRHACTSPNTQQL